MDTASTMTAFTHCVFQHFVLAVSFSSESSVLGRRHLFAMDGYSYHALAFFSSMASCKHFQTFSLVGPVWSKIISFPLLDRAVVLSDFPIIDPVIGRVGLWFVNNHP